MRLMASAFTSVLGLMVVVTCVCTTQMGAECCVRMHNACGAPSVEGSCCRGEDTSNLSLAAVKPASTIFAAAVLGAPIDVRHPQNSSFTGLARAERSSLTPSGIPTYLFIASFRI
jgi:hypothetical protein